MDPLKATFYLRVALVEGTKRLLRQRLFDLIEGNGRENATSRRRLRQRTVSGPARLVAGPRRPNGDRSADQNGDDFDRGRQHRLQHHQVHFKRMLAGERPRIGQDRDVKAKSRRIARESTICEGPIGQRYARNMIFLRSSSNPNVISSRFSTSGSGSSRPRRNNRRF